MRAAAAWLGVKVIAGDVVGLVGEVVSWFAVVAGRVSEALHGRALRLFDAALAFYESDGEGE